MAFDDEAIATASIASVHRAKVCVHPSVLLNW